MVNEAHVPGRGSGSSNEPSLTDVHPLATSNKVASIPYDRLHPHYTDRRFTDVAFGAVTVFVAEGQRTALTSIGTQEVEGAHYNYSDRLWSQYHDAMPAASARAKAAVGNTDSPRYFEELLRDLMQNPNLQLVHILTGVNRGNGYDYQVFGHIDQSETRPEVELGDAEVAVSEPVTPSADEEGEKGWLPDPRKSTPPESLGEALVDAISYLGSSSPREEVMAILQALDKKRITVIAMTALTGYAIPESGELTEFELEIALVAQWCNERGMLRKGGVLSGAPIEFVQTMDLIRHQYLTGRRQL